MKLQTLKKRKNFILSNQFAKKCHSKNFILQKYKDPEQKNINLKFGFTATKRIGNAVYRNRAKRRMKALIILFLKNNLLKTNDAKDFYQVILQNEKYLYDNILCTLF